MTKTIVVVGATGNQGGSVVNTFLADKSWHIRAITRDKNSSKAQALQAKGVEVVSADLLDIDSLTEAFKGAHAIFGVTSWDINLFFDPETPKKLPPGQTTGHYVYGLDLQQGKNIFAAAAKVDTLERLIFSGIAGASKWSGGKYKQVYHFDAKSDAVDYAQEAFPDLWKKTSILLAGWFLDNWLLFPMASPRKQADSSFLFPLIHVHPDQKFPLFAPDQDTGPFAYSLIVHEPTAGLRLITYRAWTTLQDYAETFARVNGVVARAVPTDEVVPGRKIADVGADEEFWQEMLEMMAFLGEFGYVVEGDRAVVHPRDLKVNPQLDSVEDWVKAQDWSAILNQ